MRAQSQLAHIFSLGTLSILLQNCNFYYGRSLSLKPNVLTDFSDFTTDGNFRLAHNYLVHQNSNACAEQADKLLKSDSYLRKIAEISDELFLRFFKFAPSSESCTFACLDIGSPAHLIPNIFAEKTFDAKTNATDMDWYANSCQMKEIGFVGRDVAITIYWLDSNGDRMFIANADHSDGNALW